MPQRGRSRRVAARQAQLGQRKKRQTRGSPGMSPATHAPQVGDAEALPSPEDGADHLGEKRPDAVSVVRRPGSSSPLGTGPAAAQRPSVGAGPRTRPSPGRQAQPRPTVYDYVKPEIKRIAILSAGIVAILIVLTFVLK